MIAAPTELPESYTILDKYDDPNGESKFDSNFTRFSYYIFILQAILTLYQDKR